MILNASQAESCRDGAPGGKPGPGTGSRAVEPVAADGRSLSTRRSHHQSIRAAPLQPREDPRRHRRPPTSQSVSPETDVRTHVVDFGDPWDFGLVYEALHDFTEAYSFDPENEDYLVHVTTGTHVAQICLFLLTETRSIPGSPGSDGAADVDTRQPNPGRSASSISICRNTIVLPRAFNVSSDRTSRFSRPASTRAAGSSTRSSSASSRLRSPHAPQMLIAGPTGAGKSKLARRIYELKKSRQRLTGAFVEVNCATIRGDAAASALFGHVRGSFTGAVRDRPGLLRSADGGVLFLDEIGELGADEQGVLLRAIEEKQFLPLGADREVEQRFPADRRNERGPGRARPSGPVPRGSARAHQPVDLPSSGTRPTSRGCRAEPRTRAGCLFDHHRHAAVDEP